MGNITTSFRNKCFMASRPFAGKYLLPFYTCDQRSSTKPSKTMPFKAYGQLFTQAAPTAAVGQVNPYQLADDLKEMQEHSLATIGRLKEEELQADLEPTGFPHPIAKNKLEALDWNIKHTLWHCGQLALIKRVIDKQYEFNLSAK
jgi:hypothetical protein